MGAGTGYAEGNDGNDTLLGGSGKTVMYGNNGKDLLISGVGAKGTFAHMDGGNDDDLLISQSPFNVVHGGNGNDLMLGVGRTTFYTGRGHDTVISNTQDDKIHASPGDRISRVPGSTLTQVKISDAGSEGLNLQGSETVKQRAQDDLELLRHSPTAQKMLNELDAAAKRTGAPINIIETHDGTQYSFANDFTRETDRQLKDYDDLENFEKVGFIKNDIRGSPANGASIFNNPSIIYSPTEVSPLVDLYHEMAHAYNGAHGTLLPGTTEKSDLLGPEPNLERQAIGIETDAPAFDFDNDPTTPPTTANPKAFTENGLREEMGFPLREKFYIAPHEE
nr:M91 family zinc metallopeptidase [Pseudomonas karstica]